MILRRTVSSVPPPLVPLGDAVPIKHNGSTETPSLSAGSLLDLAPIPVAIIAIADDRLVFQDVNDAFRAAGLGATADESPLVAAIGADMLEFLRSTDLQRRIALRLGESVDCRYFDVTLARRTVVQERPRCMVTLIDQTPAQRTEISLRREMSTDALTGLPNRTGFGDWIDEQVTDANRASHAVLAVNLDRFSRVNACMGSMSGDELLISVARRLKSALRIGDVLARTGGDEFAVLLTLTEASDDASQVADRMHASLLQPFRLSDFQIQVDCSIGIALGVDAMNDPEDLIRHAQFALKQAKRTGQTETYHPQLFEIVRSQFSIETELRTALEQGGLHLAFQPICDLSTGLVSSFEALARWNTADGRSISPVDFIPVAEESGLIVPLGRWAMEEAARTLVAWDVRAGGDCGTRMAVNLSAVQLQRDNIEAMVGNTLTRYALSGDRFTIELTESALVMDPDRTLRTMLTLKEMGTSIAMDDFGTGYSNLAYLQKLPIDKLKIDRSLVTGMLADRDKVAIVRAILSLSQALGMRTVAEGIETQELEQTLVALGCAFGQGYYYTRPIGADDAYRYLVARNN